MQIVKVVVASSDPTRSPPALILDLAVKGALATREEDDAHISAATDGNQLSADGTSSLIGRIVRGEVAKVLPRGVRVKLPDNGDVFALLPLEHLVDHVAYCRAAAASLVPGAIIPELLVMEESSEGDIAVSQKPLLLSAARADGSADLLPRSISDLTAGNTAVGVVYKVEDFGIFVRFLGGLTALCPRSLVDEQFVANAQGLFSVGDSVRCTIQRVDAAAGRLVVTFKSSATPSHPGALYLETALREGYISAVQPQSDDSGEELGRTLPVLGRAAVGGTCDGVVTAIREYGVILERSDGCVMICLPQHSQAGLQEGDKVKARILELDVEKRLLNVSLDPDVVRFGRRKHKSPPPAAGTTCSAVVLLADAESPHAVASLENGALGYIAIADYHCPTKSVQDVAELVSEGATVSVRVASVMEGGVFDGIALLRIQEPSRQTRRLRSRTLSDVGDDPSAPALPRDEIVIGTVLELPVKSIKADVARLTLQVQEEDGTRVSALARLHITDAPSPSEENVDPLAVPMDMSGLPKWHPFAEISQGDWLSVTVVDVKMKDGRLIVDLSTKQVGEDLGDDMDDDEEEDSAKERLSWESSVIPAAGDVCRGVIASVEDDGCWVHLSPEVKAYVGLLELSSEQEVLARPRDHFAAGMPVLLVIIWVDAQRHHIEARLRLPPAVCAAAKKMPESGRLSLGADGLALPFAEGDVVMGRLDLRRKAPLPPALMINLGTRCSGRVCATEVRDPGEWEDAPLMFQRCVPSTYSPCLASFGPCCTMSRSTPQMDTRHQQRPTLKFSACGVACTASLCSCSTAMKLLRQYFMLLDCTHCN
jgi:ribosomal protein S1